MDRIEINKVLFRPNFFDASSDAYMRQKTMSSLVQILTLFGTKPLSKPMPGNISANL